MAMDEFSLDNYYKALNRLRTTTPDEYAQWLNEAKKLVRDQFGDLTPEASAMLVVQVAGHLALSFVGGKIDLSLGIIQDACEQIGNR